MINGKPVYIVDQVGSVLSAVVKNQVDDLIIFSDLAISIESKV